MSKPIYRRVCGTHMADKPQDGDKPPNDTGGVLRALTAASAAIAAGAVPRLFPCEEPATQERPATHRPRLDTVHDCVAALAAGVQLTGDELARVYGTWRRSMRARDWPLDLYSPTRREDDPLQ